MTQSLTKLLRAPRAAVSPACELCAAPLQEPHGHSVDTAERRLLCICYACELLFAAPGAARGRFKIVPKRYAAIPAPLFSEAQWDALGIPIGLAFFFESAAAERVVAFYPGPAGATESQLPLDAWRELRAREPLVADMTPDVEAVLVYRRKDGETQAYVVPVDVCYELTGIVRSSWSGVQGGDDVHARIDAFFDEIARRASEAAE